MRRYLLLAAALMLIDCLYAQQLSITDKKITEPDFTRIYTPVPEVVTPGMNGSPPSDAIILLGSDGMDSWHHGDSSACKWTYEDGIVTVKPGTGGLDSKEVFGSVQLHVEWRTPAEVISESQGRGNSGVFLQKLYEVQILDSYENETYVNGQSGSIYKQYVPLVNASKPPGVWQSYDIIFEAPEFNSGGVMIRPAYITVFHNGVLIQNHVELKGPTEDIGFPSYRPHGELPIHLQDHGNFVSYRNIWVRRLN